LVDQIEILLNAAWQRLGCQIDPWGRCGPGQADTDGSDLGMEIDPWGDEEGTNERPGGELGMIIDPWG